MWWQANQRSEISLELAGVPSLACFACFAQNVRNQACPELHALILLITLPCAALSAVSCPVVPCCVVFSSQAQFTGQSMETITRDTDRDFFMSPQEAIEYGLVDAIISKPQVLPTRELATA